MNQSHFQEKNDENVKEWDFCDNHFQIYNKLNYFIYIEEVFLPLLMMYRTMYRAAPTTTPSAVRRTQSKLVRLLLDELDGELSSFWAHLSAATLYRPTRADTIAKIPIILDKCWRAFSFLTAALVRHRASKVAPKNQISGSLFLQFHLISSSR